MVIHEDNLKSHRDELLEVWPDAPAPEARQRRLEELPVRHRDFGQDDVDRQDRPRYVAPVESGQQKDGGTRFGLLEELTSDSQAAVPLIG